MVRSLLPILATASVLALSACSTYVAEPIPEDRMSYPVSPQSQQVDHYHGVAVADPYRWLENMHSIEVNEWVQAQNNLSLPYLQALPDREPLKERLTSLWNFERLSTPFRVGERYFFYRNDGLQNQAVLFVTESLNRPPRVLINPNKLSSDGTVSLSRAYVSPNANYIAYGISDGGSDWVEFNVRDVRTGEDTENRITGTKFTNISWLPDETGFYYSRYPEGEDGLPDDQQTVRIYFHRIGSAQANDELVYQLEGESSINPYPQVTANGRFLLANLTEGFFANGMHVLDLTDPNANWQPLFDKWDARYSFIEADGNIFYFYTTNNAPNGRVIAVDINRPQTEHWQGLISEKPETIDTVNYVGGRFFVSYLKDAQSEVHMYSAHGRYIGPLDLPEIGSVTGFTGDAEHLETFYQVSGFTQPGAIYHYNIASGESALYRQTEVNAQLDEYVTEQVFYESNDGTAIPMFIVRHQDTLLDGNNPVLLYGYGGFNVSLTPSFSVGRIVWLEQGGILAVPNLRGGGEYGDAWHQAGTKLNKQNVFDDFIAAAEYLIANNYTSAGKIAAQGGSNGGLLVAASALQRPELFGAVLPAVGVLDMLRYHTPSANARAWSSDYGLSENADEFAALHAYSPVHNTQPGTCYPPMLITTGDHDDRVVPWHSYKFAAVMQRDQGCAAPILLRVETRAGHGAGTPTWMAIEQIADQWAFLLKHLGVSKTNAE